MTYYFVYLVLCADGSFYCGYTNDPDRRLREHLKGKGGAFYFRFKRHQIKEMRVIFTCETRAEAMQLERNMKHCEKTTKHMIFYNSLNRKYIREILLR